MTSARAHKRHSRHVTRGPRLHVLRMAVLERDGYRCRSCGARGRLEVDHVEPVRTRPDRAYDPSNLQSLCARCHTRKTRIECGHPEPSPAVREWRAAVAELETKSSNNEGKSDS